jgi:hypothetical protein
MSLLSISKGADIEYVNILVIFVDTLWSKFKLVVPTKYTSTFTIGAGVTSSKIVLEVRIRDNTSQADR